ncbi:hypothetical protein AACH06_29295 [Ideonella sp. DXS29W]|uniref:Uncharacterized protein n=1 Tax=Ideonella lacteola TaxID=2984193 RepID=A0ABU9BY77_9BURK
MLSANYTSENVCRAMGMGGFANDWQLAEADQSIRVLLLPSFHREVCVSVLCKGSSVLVSVVAAVSQIWLQDWPVPQSTSTEQDSGTLAEPQFANLSSLLHVASEPKPARRFVVVDGMRAHSVLRAEREGKLNLNQNVAYDPSYRAFVAELVSQSHSAIKSPSIRNALGDAGSYVGLQLPVEVVPPAKEVVRTMVLRSPEETAQLLDALRKKHEG